ncbi:hypothetical protein GCM10022276_12050 [Sphingomonas limnosediminicola]|jgi:hypothetical protein|uniref:MarR family transcriptional regulator n=1 Tax=Sphingomonas limnosediminicola TaxID=940133 RepID=A0ABP7L546_9SPHN
MNAQLMQHGDPELIQLRDEVTEIAAKLERLSIKPGSTAADEAALMGGPSLTDVSPKTVMREIRARRLRARYVPCGAFADPAWDMMLVLFHAELVQRRITVSRLCGAAQVPPTTALRWITTLVEQKAFARKADPLDGRRHFVELSPETSFALRRYFVEVLGGDPENLC